MQTHHSECVTRTRRTMDFVDITDEVTGALSASGIRDGHVTVFSQDHECSLIVNEKESGLWTDLRATLERMNKEHPDEKRAAIGSSSVVVPAVAGRLHLGRWQRLLLIELERPTDRAVHVQIVGD